MPALNATDDSWKATGSICRHTGEKLTPNTPHSLIHKVHRMPNEIIPLKPTALLNMSPALNVSVHLTVPVGFCCGKIQQSVICVWNIIRFTAAFYSLLFRCFLILKLCLFPYLKRTCKLKHYFHQQYILMFVEYLN